ncbi:Tn3 family transposase [Aureispira anguillae]|uniref:Tn3 family transposase n=1 Tax=Aureispira anguillae TaxID=2864201 RepID=A0A915YLZ5_9BACT|nr:Tn3 family transposase [Aureispira anguillae]BDS15680.1 Tn3 family transposase [Aureispira anguillae]
MPLIKILSDKKRTEYEQVPSFNAEQRKHFFNLPASLKNKVYNFSSISNKVGFRLMFGYFLATKRFYSIDQFCPKDIKYLCNQYGAMPFAFDLESYKSSTYSRHRQLILDHFCFNAYQPKIHNSLISSVIKEQIYSWEVPYLIVRFIVDWLEWRKIECPSYYSLQIILTQSIRNRNRAIRQKFGHLLKEEHRQALDQLSTKIERNGWEEYTLTTLQKLNPSDSPNQIKANTIKLELIQSIFKTIEPILQALNINDNAVRHFGEIVQRSESSHIFRKESTDLYFHLALFCAYQRCVFEDWMARTLISVCKVATNKAIAQEKEKLFQQRKEHRAALKRVMTIAEDSTELLEKVRQLTWMNISAQEKEQKLQQLLPKTLQTTEQPEDLQQIKEQQLSNQDDYYSFLAQQSQALQKRVNPILKKLTFHTTTSDPKLLRAIQYFKDKKGNITQTAPTDFLKIADKQALTSENGKLKAPLYKILLFQKITDAIDRGSLHLKYTYKYQDMNNYLIPKDLWENNSDSFLEKANLMHLKEVKSRINDYKKMLHFHYKNTNTNILAGQNKYFQKSKNNKYRVVTPKIEKLDQDYSLFPDQAVIPLSEVLSTVDTTCNFLQHFQHTQPLYAKKRPDKSLFYAGLTAYGCNIGVHTMAKTTSQLRASQLENTTNWYFSVNSINKANDAITKFIDQLPVADLYRKRQGELRTSSDGQKIKLVSSNTIFAHYSGKYFRKGKGIVAYSFIDERYIPFYSVIIDAPVREATFVLDGLLHNDVIKSTIHTTDTHGYTEAIFGLTDLLGFGFCPNIAKMLRQTIYTFKENTIRSYTDKEYLVLPKAYIQEQLIENNWNEILRIITSLKLKYCTASQVLSRFNSYSKQHPLYAAIKEYGRIVKTLHVLRYTDDLEMRQDSRKLGNAIESSNRFSNAVAFANGGELIFLTRTEQQIANACKNLIKNAIICWNYLYLTRKIQKIQNATQVQQLIQTIKQKTVNSWRHVYFTGTYDFSDEKLADSFSLLHSQNYSLFLN